MLIRTEHHACCKFGNNAAPRTGQREQLPPIAYWVDSAPYPALGLEFVDDLGNRATGHPLELRPSLPVKPEPCPSGGGAEPTRRRMFDSPGETGQPFRYRVRDSTKPVPYFC